jgi:hypothetical protein
VPFDESEGVVKQHCSVAVLFSTASISEWRVSQPLNFVFPWFEFLGAACFALLEACGF